MTSRTKFIAALSIPAILCLAGIYSFWSSGQVAQYVKLQGYVHDQITGKPLSGCTLAIFNCIKLEDGSYAEDKTLYIKTDADGHYEITFPNSYLIYIRAFKNGYAIARSGAVRSQRDTEYNFILEQGNDPESDLYKEGETLEVIQ